MERINTLINSTLGERRFRAGEYLAQPLSAQYVEELGQLNIEALPEGIEHYAILGAANLSASQFQTFRFDEIKTCSPQDYVWEIYDLQLIYGHSVVQQVVECL